MSPMGAESRMADDDVQYEFKEVRAIRGAEGKTTRKWQDSGWNSLPKSRGRCCSRS